MTTAENPFVISERGRLLRNETLAPLSSFKIGGPAEYLLLPGHRDDVVNGLRFARDSGLPWRIIGSGSNLLIPDAGLPGLTIKFWHHFDRITVSGSVLTAEAGAEMLTVAKAAAGAGLSGLEWASGIPGTVGGAVFMNAGVKDYEVKNVLIHAVILREDGTIRSESVEELELAYRSSRLQHSRDVVLEAHFSLQSADSLAVFRKMNDFLDSRKRTQPIDQPNCGSVFRNPPGDFAGRLIEQCGLKGASFGDAMISNMHANFIVNRGTATAEDVLKLVDLIRGEVFRTFGVQLQLEMRTLQ